MRLRRSADAERRWIYWWKDGEDGATKQEAQRRIMEVVKEKTMKTTGGDGGGRFSVEEVMIVVSNSWISCRLVNRLRCFGVNMSSASRLVLMKKSTYINISKLIK